MIVIDGSVWIGLLRNSDSPSVRQLRDIVDAADDQVLVGDLILLEVLQGARDEAHAARTERNLRRYPIVPMLVLAGSDWSVCVMVAHESASH